MRLSITVDANLLDRAQSLSGAKTKRETIELALRELIAKESVKKALALEGSDVIDMTVDDLLRWRKMGTEGTP